MNELYKANITSVILEGGPSIWGSFFDAQLIDKVMFVIAPKIIGGKCALGSIAGQGVGRISLARSLKELKVREIESNLIVEGYLN